MSITSYQRTYFTGYIGDPPKKILHPVMKIDDKLVNIYDVTVHHFNMGDVEDPDLYAAQPIWEWQKTEKGQWVMEHAMESPVWHKMIDYNNFGYTYVIRAKLKATDYTFYQLKWS